jgi:hypothetical protein
MAVAIHRMRVHLEAARDDGGEYGRGKVEGLRLALTMLYGIVGTEGIIKVGAGGCPDCYAALPGDGSCCDECGWTRPV